MSNDKARTLIRSCELKLKEVFQKLSSGFEKHGNFKSYIISLY